ncbi:lysozyme g-like isoform X1 [Rana temporaria]|uniref:lysozyme g-like isoform X1 n=2 Tax=Rana temporaria TaxID=8407 RepID=UPI001AAD24C1|nr:lysozyme g-like isoform X1 [Rana temporaria]XP_040192291.1 lysozyme g-like isoform X1 [Rana temporaria]
MDINDIPTTGASCATAKQDKLKVCGVEASKKMAQNDLGRINKYKSNILSVAKQKNTDPSIIAGIMSRESRGGSVLKDGWGDHNNGFGLMQVDKRYHTPKGTWYSETHIAQAVDIFNSTYNQIEKKFPGQPKEGLLKGAIAGYNTGAGNVRDLNNVDQCTTGNDYGNDVVARAQFFKSNGY